MTLMEYCIGKEELSRQLKEEYLIERTNFVHFIAHVAALTELSWTQCFGSSIKKQASLWKTLLTDELMEGISHDNFDQKLDILIGKCPLPDEHRSSYKSEAIARFDLAEPLSSCMKDRVSPMKSCRLSFFTTSNGFCGLCAPGAQLGDELILLLRDEDYPDVPYIARRLDEEHHAMIAVALVQDDWEEVCDGEGPFETQPFKFK
ncbi:hypothetical protein FB567DRAFT_594592 [Paraphoma chrysanthemicola]|uniref:Uncharacterized protein n=1 Tax=Paraphoma chrysanthemicola TaxID=798071 RepID=A0A8K0R0Z0_9PLEO|nr:hypothetical protein FB567DRAFT_594592 [Paraphoma chrysanthemicola]